MKKIKFYSLHKDNINNGKIEARLHDGYTDGKFNYYKMGTDTWWAIDPDTGIAVGNDKTRKLVMEMANSDKIMERLEKYKESENYQKLIEQLNNVVSETEQKTE